MLAIGTHDSITGERTAWWCVLFILFAKTQHKTLKEQYDAGCRLFDIRIKKVFGKWRGAHGWWFTKYDIETLLSTINYKDVNVNITYEGKEEHTEEFKQYVLTLKNKFHNINWGDVCAKYSKNSKGIIVKYSNSFYPRDTTYTTKPNKQAFLPLDGKHWQTYIPIPILWKQFYFKNVTFNEDYFQYVDFL